MGTDDGPEALRALLEALPDGVVVTDPDGLITFVNHQFEQLSGYPRDELAGTSVDLLVPADVRDRHRRLRTAAGRRLREISEMGVLRLVRRDGTLLEVEIGISPIRDPVTGRCGIAAAVRDVSAARRTEQQLRRVLRLLDVVPDAVFIVDVATRTVQHANRSAADLLGYPPEELIGVPAARLRPEVAEEERTGTFERLAASGRHELITGVTLRTRSGEDLPCEVHLAHAVDDDGTRYIVNAVRDLRGRVAAQQAAEQRRAREAASQELASRVTTAVLAGSPTSDAYRETVEGTLEVFAADAAALLLADPLTGRTTTAARAVRFDGTADNDADDLDDADATDDADGSDGGPRIEGSFTEPWTGAGVLVVSRRPGAPPFTAHDRETLTRLAHDVALAVGLGMARSAEQRLALTEDRTRIARDLHDTVIQDLIAIGMQLNRRPSALVAGPTGDAERDAGIVHQLEEAVRRLRAAVFELGSRSGGATTADDVRALVADATRVLGYRPQLALSGDVAGLPDLVADQVLAVLRESLSNVARHAGANAVDVDLRVRDRRVVLDITDNGHGLPTPVVSGDGLRNMQQRALLFGGTARISSRPDGGTRVRWSCPLGTGTQGVVPARAQAGPPRTR